MAAFNFTANMTEVDNASVGSNMTSYFSGVNEIEVEELQWMQNVISKDRKRLIDNSST